MSQQELEFRQEVRNGLSTLKELVYKALREVHEVRSLLRLIYDQPKFDRLAEKLDQEREELVKATDEAVSKVGSLLRSSAVSDKAKTTFNDLQQKVTAMGDAVQSAKTALQTLGQFMKDHSSDAAAIDAMGTMLTQQHDDLVAAILANTPQQPNPTPNTPPNPAASGSQSAQVKSQQKP